MDARNHRQPTIGFVVKTYPKLSETFILGELLGLEALGMRLSILSLQRPTDAFAHAHTHAVQAPVRYLAEPASFGRVLAQHARVMLRHPGRYLRAAARMMRSPTPWQTFALAGCLAAELLAQRIEHVHAHFASEPAQASAIASAMIGGSFSMSAHAKDIYMSDPVALGERLRAARFTVTCTDYNRRHLQGLGGPSASVHRMYHGIDLQRFNRPAAHATPSAPATPVILSVGRLREKKGFPTLIEACAELAARGVPFECEIVGYGPDEAGLRAQIAALGLSTRVRLLGKLPQDRVIEAYSRAALFVLPCQIGADGDRDGIPNVLLEAMAMRLAVISTPVSGIPEVIHDGVNGVLIAERDPHALAAAIARLLGDADTRERLGAQARRTVAEQFSNDRNLRLVRGLLLAGTRPTAALPAIEARQTASHARSERHAG